MKKTAFLSISIISIVIFSMSLAAADKQTVNFSSTGTDPCSITINQDLSFTIPNAIYDAGPPVGQMAVSLEFKFFGEQNGQLLWQLGNVDASPSFASCSISIAPDLSFTLANAIYDAGPSVGQMTLQAVFEYSGEQVSSLLWRLVDIKIINDPPVIPQDNIIQVGDASLEIVYAGLDSEAESRTLLARQMEMHGSALLQAVILTNSALMVDQTTIDAVEWSRRLDLAEQAWAIAEQVNTSLKNQSSQLELATNKVVSQNLQAAELELMVDNLQGSRGEIQRLAESQGVDIREMRHLLQAVIDQQRDQELNAAQRYGMAAELIYSISNAASGLALAVGGFTLMAGSAPVTIPGAVAGGVLFVVGGTTAILNTTGGIVTVLNGEGQGTSENVVFSTLNETTSILGVVSGEISDSLFYLGGKAGGMVDLDALGHTVLTFNSDGTVSFMDIRSEEYEQYIANQYEPVPFTTGRYNLPDGTLIDVNDDLAFQGVRIGLSHLTGEQLLVTTNGTLNQPGSNVQNWLGKTWRVRSDWGDQSWKNTSWSFTVDNQNGTFEVTTSGSTKFPCTIDQNNHLKWTDDSGTPHKIVEFEFWLTENGTIAGKFEGVGRDNKSFSGIYNAD